MQALRRLGAVGLLGLWMAVGCTLAGCRRQSSAPPTRSQLIQQAEADLQAGRLDHARDKLNKLVRADQNNSQVHIDLGWVSLYNNQLPQAMKEVQTAAAQDPENPAIHHLKGALLTRLGQPEAALEEYDQALTTQQGDPRLHDDIADAFLKLDSPEDALKAIDIAIRLDPNNTAYAFRRCVTLRQLARYQDAYLACQTTLNITTDPTERLHIREVMENIRLLQQLDVAPTPQPPDLPQPPNAAAGNTPAQPDKDLD